MKLVVNLLPIFSFYVANRGIVDACVAKNYVLPTAKGPISTFPPPALHTFATVAGLQEWAVYLNTFETPIAIRFTHLIDMMNWNCAAIYSDSWKDSLTKKEPLLHTPKETILENGDTTIQLHSSDLRLLCMVNTWAAVIEDWIPEATEAISDYVETFMYPGIELGYNSEVDACFDLTGDGSSNNDCLYEVASESCFAPSIIGKIVGRQLNEYAKRDGWNMYGELNSDGSPCNANCRRYTDPTGGIVPFKDREPVGNETLDPSIEWKPLLEDNGRGYFVQQLHVTPHIGQIANTAILSRDDFDSRTTNNPNFDYKYESQLVIERMSTLQDYDKMEIEFFDNKIDLAFAIVGSVAQNGGASFEQILNFVVGLTASEYDSILLAWKEKVHHNLIRPTTWIQENMSDETFVTWTEGGEIKEVHGKNFEAYIRVMPHSEYVSGSACLCQSLYEFTDSWVSTNLGMEDSIPISVELEKHSSKREPGITPSDDLVLTYSNTFAIRNACGESRLKGGMHFTASVPVAYELCEGVGTLAGIYAEDLWGDVNSSFDTTTKSDDDDEVIVVENYNKEEESTTDDNRGGGNVTLAIILVSVVSSFVFVFYAFCGARNEKKAFNKDDTCNLTDGSAVANIP